MGSSKAAFLSEDLLLIIVPLTYPTNVHGLIRLSQVCRHWRHTIISYPSLWTNLDIIYPNVKKISFVNMMLTRSADCPLQVAFTIYNEGQLEPNFLSCCDLIFAHILRIETFTIVERGPQNTAFLDYVFSAFTNPAPMLKAFRFLRDSYSVPPVKPVPKDFLYQIAPKLEELKLSHLFVSYQMPIFKSITRISLWDIGGITSGLQLLDILETTSKNLRVLDLHGLVDLDLEELSGRSVQLSSLQSLSLRLDSVLLMFLLDHIKVPSDINWKIHCFDAVVALELDVTPLLRFVKRVRTGTFLDLTLEYDANEVLMEFGKGIHADSNASLTMYLSPYPLDSIDRVHGLFASLGLSKVDNCNITVSDDLPEWLNAYKDTFGSLFFLFDGLRELSIFCDGEGDGITNDALLPLIAQLRPTRTLPCPLLNDLTLDPVPTTNKSWIRVLKERKEAGNNLRRLQVLAQPYDPRVQEELKTLVVKNVR